ncbi:MAG: DUF5060 domain-containing protein [Verrucomicrobiales bacterium]|nr:DUF5060 domain-containing protein [Verrucomicrobiales bacterium]
MRFLAPLLCLFVCSCSLAEDGDGSVTVTGDLQTWHTVTLTLDGPYAEERSDDPNPFTHFEFQVTFTHESGQPSYLVPGYFAADGRAGETSAEQGTKWRAHLSPDKPGKWNYETRLFRLGPGSRNPEPAYHQVGSFEVTPTDKGLPDFRIRGRLTYIGERYLQFAGDKSYFLKAGPDAPETLLAYADFDGTTAENPGKSPLKTWAPHLSDWKEGDPTWKDGKGKALIGALNYLAAKKVNAFSFLTYNAGGDGENVWPFVERDEKFHYDCSKLDQWGVVFDHARSKGLHLHFKLQETENDDNRHGHKEEKVSKVPTSLDGGALGPQRKLYLRELIARYGHHLALNWNIGEENTQSPDQVRAMAKFIRDTDPYDHPIVIHTFPNQQDKVYPALVGDQSVLTGASLQNPWRDVHRRTKQWIAASAKAGKQWVVANDEQNPAGLGVPPDPGYKGFDGWAKEKKSDAKPYDWTDIRRETLWGNLMAGGAGVEYYFGYQLPENDLICEDFRSRDQSWDACRIALEFFQENGIPFPEMKSADERVGNPEGKSGLPWCLAKPGGCYVIFAPASVKEVHLTWSGESKALPVRRFFPDTGEWPEVDEAFTTTVSGDVDKVVLPTPEDRDVVFLIRE